MPAALKTPGSREDRGALETPGSPEAELGTWLGIVTQ